MITKTIFIDQSKLAMSTERFAIDMVYTNTNTVYIKHTIDTSSKIMVRKDTVNFQQENTTLFPVKS